MRKGQEKHRRVEAREEQDGKSTAGLNMKNKSWTKKVWKMVAFLIRMQREDTIWTLENSLPLEVNE
jgi:hypothetical protein